MNIEIDFMQVLRSSFTLAILFLCSVIALTVIIERWWVLRRNNVDLNWLLKSVRRYLLENRFADALTFLSKQKSAIAVVLREGIQKRTLSRPDLEEFLVNIIVGESMQIEKRMGILGTLGSMTPFIGLFGTVLGIVRAFKDLATASGGGPSVVAAGIAEALVATAAGLMVAIPALMFFNYFSGKTKSVRTKMEMAARNLILLLYAKERMDDGNRPEQPGRFRSDYRD